MNHEPDNLYRQHALCCAITELNGLCAVDGPEEVVEYLCNPCYELFHRVYWDREQLIDQFRKNIRPITLFTGAHKDKGRPPAYSKNLMAYIKKHKLGKVTLTPPVQNPASGNYVTLYSWTIDYEGMCNWWISNVCEGD